MLEMIDIKGLGIATTDEVDNSHDHYDGGAMKRTFMGMPQEVRMLIYDKLVGDRTFWVSMASYGSARPRCGIIGSLSILRVNKQIHEEAMAILRVRTLRLNKFQHMDFNLLPTIPARISRWTNTIESVLAGYNSVEFDMMTNLPGDEAHSPLLFQSLKDLIKCLPLLRNLTITCDGYPSSSPRSLENRFMTIARELKNDLLQFEHITCTINETGSGHYEFGDNVKDWKGQMMFRKGTDQGKKVVGDLITFDEKPVGI